MIISFGNEITKDLFHGIENRKTQRFSPEIRKIAKRKLDMIEFATVIKDLRTAPANRLEKLKGNFIDFYSIRINDQWRIIFRWKLDGAYDVQIIDYH